MHLNINYCQNNWTRRHRLILKKHLNYNASTTRKVLPPAGRMRHTITPWRGPCRIRLISRKMSQWMSRANRLIRAEQWTISSIRRTIGLTLITKNIWALKRLATYFTIKVKVKSISKLLAGIKHRAPSPVSQLIEWTFKLRKCHLLTRHRKWIRLM
jgi:hypothetical protein